MGSRIADSSGVVEGLPIGLEYDLSELPDGQEVTLRPAGDDALVAPELQGDRRSNLTEAGTLGQTLTWRFAGV